MQFAKSPKAYDAAISSVSSVRSPKISTTVLNLPPDQQLHALIHPLLAPIHALPLIPSSVFAANLIATCV